jgi:EpsI family protein
MNKIAWVPAIMFGFGGLFTVGIDGQRDMALDAPIATLVDARLEGYESSELTLDDDQIRVAGVDDYVLRQYDDPDADLEVYSVYVGYYESQLQGRTIHSPKNCLPGAGWEALQSDQVTVNGPEGEVVVNQYLIQNDEQKALVLYWYQGRGRVESNEYRVKWDLLVDAAVRRRTEEALVRIVVPIPIDHRGDEAAQALAVRVAERLVPELSRALPS